MNIFTSKIYSITSASKERVFFLSSLQFSQQNAVTPTAWKSRRVTISPPSFSRHLKSSPPCVYIYTRRINSLRAPVATSTTAGYIPSPLVWFTTEKIAVFHGLSYPMRFHPPMRAQFSHSHGFYILTRTGVGLGSFFPSFFFFFFYAQNTGNILTRRSLCTETRVDRNPGGVVRNSVAEEWKYVLRIFPQRCYLRAFLWKRNTQLFQVQNTSFFERILSRDRLLFERASFDRIYKKRAEKGKKSLLSVKEFKILLSKILSSILLLDFSIDFSLQRQPVTGFHRSEKITRRYPRVTRIVSRDA